MSSPAPHQPATYLRRVNELAEQLLTADDPYDVAVQLWETSGRAVEASALSGSICALWGALTDWVECRRDEEEFARGEMVRAARAWLALNVDDPDAVDRYFEYWLHEVCGYERRSDSR